MVDPLAEVIALLRPRAALSKMVTAASPWAVRPPREGPFYVVVLEGEISVRRGGDAPVRFAEGDFALIPAADDLEVTSVVPPRGGRAMEPALVQPAVYHLGERGRIDTRMLIGHCAFGAQDAVLLMSLLPDLVVVHGDPRLTTLVQLLSDEARATRPARETVLARLLEVLLIEAFRAGGAVGPAPGLLRGLADERLAVALRRMHGEPTHRWTAGTLAREAALSRSIFFERFRREVGVAPMEYLLGWRMALAKDLLGNDRGSVAEVAERVGYSSQSTFSVAFTRFVGMSPSVYAVSPVDGTPRGYGTPDVRCEGGPVPSTAQRRFRGPRIVTS